MRHGVREGHRRCLAGGWRRLSGRRRGRRQSLCKSMGAEQGAGILTWRRSQSVVWLIVIITSARLKAKDFYNSRLSYGVSNYSTS